MLPSLSWYELRSRSEGCYVQVHALVLDADLLTCTGALQIKFCRHNNQNVRQKKQNPPMCHSHKIFELVRGLLSECGRQVRPRALNNGTVKSQRAEVSTNTYAS